MTNPETSPPKSPIDELSDKYGLYFSPEEREAIIKRLQELDKQDSEDN